jgi:hypothetical protein
LILAVQESNNVQIIALKNAILILDNNYMKISYYLEAVHNLKDFLKGYKKKYKS